MLIKLNDYDISNIVVKFPVISTTKATAKSRAYSDYIEIEIISQQFYTLLDDYINTIVIEVNGVQKFTGYLLKVIYLQDDRIRIVAGSLYSLKSKNNIIYQTNIRGDGITTFTAAEYFLDASIYYETPVYAVKHLLEIAGITDFDTASLSEANTNYVNNNIYCQLENEYIGYSLQQLLDKICTSFNLFFFTNNQGQIVFDYNNSKTEIVLNNYEINQIDGLEFYNNYSIEKDDFTIITAGIYGQTYRDRTKTNRYFFIDRDILKIYDYLTGPVNIGQEIIDQYYRSRKGFRLKQSMTNILNINSEPVLTDQKYNFNNKHFEIYSIKEDFDNSKQEIIIYEKL